jgi:mRNA-degrading endonuclease toxin of MazEF toxin-antitoxin module
MLNILSVDFPFLDNPGQSKRRPALALTKPLGKYKIVIIAYITTHLDDVLQSNVPLDLQEDELSTTGLAEPSVIMLHKVVGVVEGRVQGQLGVLPQRYEAEIQAKLRQLFHL